MSLWSRLFAPRAAAAWLGIAVRPGSGLGLLPAVLSAPSAAGPGLVAVASLAAFLAVQRGGR